MSDPFSTPPGSLPPTSSAAEPSEMARSAIERLRSFVRGNGMDPESVVLLGQQETTVVLPARLILDAEFEIEPQEYPGPPKGKNIKTVASYSALSELIEEKRNDFTSGTKWLEGAVAEIKTHPTQGWGLENAKVVLTSESGIFAASQPCPTCKGEKSLLCVHCHGNPQIPCNQCRQTGREICPICFGYGHYPAQPDTVCQECQNQPLGEHGMHSVQCRACRGLGWIPCPACAGKGRLPCQACNAQGQISRVMTVTGCARTTFRIEPKGEVPSGVLQAIHRMGAISLTKGHADITMNLPREEKDNPASSRTFTYDATIPYADVRLRFGKGKAVQIAVFGKKKVILNCPPFLDIALEEARKLLKNPKFFDKALETRLIKEAVSLRLSGKGAPSEKGVNDLRRLYPIGLSPQVALEILKGVTNGLKGLTVKARTVAALLLTTLAALASAGWVTASKTVAVSVEQRMAIDLFIAALLAFLVFSGVRLFAKISLQKRFPDATLTGPLFAGKIGLLASVAAALIHGALRFYLR